MVPEWVRQLLRRLSVLKAPEIDKIVHSPRFINSACIECGLSELNGKLEALIDECADTAFRLGLGADELASDVAYRLARLQKDHEPCERVIRCLTEMVEKECLGLGIPMHRTGSKLVSIQIATHFIVQSMYASGQVVHRPD